MLAKSERMIADGGVHDLFVKRRRVRLVDQRGAEVLQKLGVRQLRFDLRAALPQRVLGPLPFRRFGARAEHSDNLTAFVAHRRIREGEPRLLVVAFPIHHERQVFVIVRLAAKRGIDQTG